MRSALSAPRPTNTAEILQLALVHHQSGDLSTAETLYHQILGADPLNFDATHLLGVAALQNRRLEAAEALIANALALSPGSAAAHNNLGTVYLRQNRLANARSHFGRAVTLQPDFAAAHLNLGTVLHRLGQPQTAAEHLQRAADLDPASVAARANLGAVLFELRDFEAALRVFEEVVQLSPARPEGYANLAAALSEAGGPEQALIILDKAAALGLETPALLAGRGMALGLLGRYAEAQDCLERVVASAPDSAAAHRNLAKLLRDTGRSRQAVAPLQRAVALEPESLATCIELIQVLHECGERSDARQRLDCLLSKHPRSAAVLAQQGSLCFERGEHAGAERAWRDALFHEPDDAGVHYQLGNLLMLTGRQQEAVQHYSKALAADPNHVQARWALAMAEIPAVAEDAGAVPSSRANFANALLELDRYFDERRTLEGHRAVGSTQPYYLAYQALDNRELLGRYGALCGRLMASWQQHHLPRIPPRWNSERIRVGFVSAHVYDHSVWHAIVKGWLKHLDRKRFEIVLFSLGGTCDTETDWAEQRADRFESGHRSLLLWAKTIAEGGLDVLIYPEIGMDAMTTRLANLRLAPIQAAAWGHPETTGLPTIDYYLSAAAFEPESSQPYYTERLVALPHLGVCYEPINMQPAQPDLAALGLPDDAPLLLCPGQPFKYAPEHDRVWAEISRRVHRARLVFFHAKDSALSRRFSERLRATYRTAGLDFDTCVSFIPIQGRPTFFGLMKQAHLFLDTIGFSGFNTVMQAVECGLPVIAHEGGFLRGRLGSGILRQMHSDELVATSDDAYVDLAVSLMGDDARREAMRRRMATRRGMLFGDTAPVRALEEFLSGAVTGLSAPATAAGTPG